MINERDKNQMKAILAGFHNAIGDKKVTLDKPQEVLSDNPEIAAMKNILSKFHNVIDKTADTLLTESLSQPDAKMALDTEVVDNGVRIGQYVMTTRLEEGKSKPTTLRDIHTSKGNHLVAQGLVLAEAAMALVKALNSGKMINDPLVVKILSLEERFNSHRNDAATFKKRHSDALRRNDLVQEDIYEAKYQGARAQALKIKEEMRKILNKL